MFLLVTRKYVTSIEMAHVEELKIKGIRSFGADDEQTINFRPPLTLIQGKNGSGKTTIIECLQYATSGNLPRSCFVHDLKPANKNQVEGEISMTFRDTQGVTATAKCVREVDKGKNKSGKGTGRNEIKEKTGNSQYYGQVKYIEEMARRLGVSQAILTDVIFCHQENCNWPFLDAGELRKKFDKIFGLNKYKNLNKELRTLYKKESNKIGEKERELKYLREKKNRKKQIIKDLDTKRKNLEEKNEKIKCLIACLKELKEEQKNIDKRIETINNMKKEKGKKANQKDILYCNVELLQNDIYKESEELCEAKQHFMDHSKKELNPLGDESTDIYLSNLKEVLIFFKQFLDEEKKKYNEGKTEMESAKKEKDRFQAEKKKIDEKVREIYMNDDLSKDLCKWKQDKIDKNSEKDTLLEKHRDILMTFLNEVPKKNFGVKVRSCLSDLRKEIKEKEGKLQEKQKCQTKLECEKSSLERDLDKKETKFKENDEKLKKKYENANLKDVSDYLEQKIAQLEEEENRISASKCLFERYEYYITELKEKYCCPLCDSKLTPISKVNEVVEKLRNEMSSPTNKKANEGELDKLKKEHEKLKTEYMHLPNDNNAIQEEIDKLKNDISSTEMKINSCQKELKDVNNILKEVKDKKECLEQIMGDMTLLDSIDKNIEKLESNITKQQLPNVSNCSLKEAINEQDSIITKCEEAQKIYEIKKSDEKDSLSKLNEICRAYSKIENDFKEKIIHQEELKGKMEELTECTEEIKKLAESIEENESGDYEKRRKEIQSEKETKFGEKCNLEGSKEEDEKHISSLEMDLSTYKDADEKFYNAFLEWKVLEAVCKDYRTLSDALDDAITKVHQDRVYSINAVIRDLWSSVYKSDDIESIEIEPKETKGTDNVKQYDYNVVVIQDGVKRDMRDRCSAGQKRLASVIIRLAIAEVLSADFGMIALDEPTANLDEENSASLGEALSEIVKRREKENFQLIIITHDQNFVQQLCRDTNMQEYYVVKRNSLNQSVIKPLNTYTDNEPDEF